ncbi:hypothetical protein IW146_006393 [Coemansia sp. RSA 922]|nr:hypothetical protein H4S04_003829 [Coemansia sp. S16]KAJ2062053.1 hypothetical protein GGI08_002746 [Coemansia sp. S2]KAJ2109379.1 hypothetical protein IW146_006393 [Coemansia sp. RSA 922]KAJ2352128.1 hypothetical protein GGH92_001443 [Coemansia sp. RSA 2673]
MGLSDELSKFIPKGFGKKKKPTTVSDDIGSDYKSQDTTDKHTAGDSANRPIIAHSGAQHPTAPALEAKYTPDTLAKTEPEASDPPKAKDNDTDDDDSDDEYPVGSHIVMKEHVKSVSALAWDPSGDLLVSGDNGSLVHMWDFRAMDGSYKPTRTLVPYEGQQVRDLRFNRSGTHLLCATSDPRAKLYESNGHPVCEFKRGDMYVSDMRKTNGHVSGLFAADWNPQSDDVFATASADGTVRIWSCERPRAQDQVLVGKARNAGAVTACRYSSAMGPAAVIAAAQMDGSISLWPANGPYLRPVSRIDSAHTRGTETSDIVFAPDGHRFATRGGDDTVKLWDIRRPTSPVATTVLATSHSATSLAFSPSGSQIMVGSPQSIAVLDISDLSVLRHIPVGKCSAGITRVLWHPRVNQIAAAATDGSLSVLYSQTQSMRGAMLCAGKRSRRRADDVQVVGPIITPHALPLFRDDDKPAVMSAGKRRREAARGSSKHAPGQPLYGHGKGGNIGINETQHIMKSIIKDTMRDEDPREALLKYAAVAESDPMFVAPAYKSTQDKPVFDNDADDQVPEMKRRK